jgi:DNA-binding XRE family transcriptional regulator
MRVDDLFARIETEHPVPNEVAAELDPPFTLASNVYRLRTEAGMSQAELARAVGVAQPRIAEIERGDSNPTLRTLSKLAFALRVELPILLAADAPDSLGEPTPVPMDWGRAVERLADGHGNLRDGDRPGSEGDLARWASACGSTLSRIGAPRRVRSGQVTRYQVFDPGYAGSIR